AVISGLPEGVFPQPGWTEAPNNYEGIRVSLDGEHGDGWFLLRLSVHDPIMPLNVESDQKGGVKRILEHLSVYLNGCDGLDLSSLNKSL
ncbi:phosphomannomutase/phosphoglucomutase, partial [Micromonospora sp. CV4]